ASAARLRAALLEAADRASSFEPSSAKRPDASAATVADRLAVIIADTFGRPWREGVVNVALGVSGLRPLLDYRRCRAVFGREPSPTVVAIADELAAAAELVMRKTAQLPVAIVRGAGEWLGDGGGAQLLRDASRDLFR